MKAETAKTILTVTRESYAIIARDFDKTRNASWEDFNIFEPFGKENMDVLDVGCGNGRLYEILKKKNISYTGIDQNEYFIEQARARYEGAFFYRASVLNLDGIPELAGHRYDVIFCVAVLSHVPSKEWRTQVMNSLKRLLKPGGVLLMLNWNLWRLAFGRKQKNIWMGWLHRIILPTDDWFIRYRLLERDLSPLDVMTWWGNEYKGAPLYYRAFLPFELIGLCTGAGFGDVTSFFTARGKHAHWWDGRNIATIARNTLLPARAEDTSKQNVRGLALDPQKG